MHLDRDQPFSSYYMTVNGEPGQIKKKLKNKRI